MVHDSRTELAMQGLLIQRLVATANFIFEKRIGVIVGNALRSRAQLVNINVTNDLVSEMLLIKYVECITGTI